MWIHLTDFLEVPALCSSTMALAYIPYQPKLILSSSSKLLQPAALISIPKQNGHLLAYDTKNPVFFLLYFWVNNSFQLPVFPKQQPCFGGVCHKLYTILLHSGAQNFFAVKPGQKKKQHIFQAYRCWNLCLWKQATPPNVLSCSVIHL